MINTNYNISSPFYNKKQNYNQTKTLFTGRIPVSDKVKTSLDNSYLYNRFLKPTKNQEAQNIIILSLNSIGIGLVDKTIWGAIIFCCGILALFNGVRDFFKTRK